MGYYPNDHSTEVVNDVESIGGAKGEKRRERTTNGSLADRRRRRWAPGGPDRLDGEEEEGCCRRGGREGGAGWRGRGPPTQYYDHQGPAPDRVFPLDRFSAKNVSIVPDGHRANPIVSSVALVPKERRGRLPTGRC